MIITNKKTMQSEHYQIRIKKIMALFYEIQLPQGYRATKWRQFTFYH